jgi:hypothetical protein
LKIENEMLSIVQAIASFLPMTEEPLNPALEPSLRGTKQSPIQRGYRALWAIASFLAMTTVILVISPCLNFLSALAVTGLSLYNLFPHTSFGGVGGGFLTFNSIIKAPP